ncbi:MAG: PD40 domain-containing protein, partial [Chrysiogenetes bacterium]|nr:PD40 domain-containing protein [Chrysiogenetes bacterium]
MPTANGFIDVFRAPNPLLGPYQLGYDVFPPNMVDEGAVWPTFTVEIQDLDGNVIPNATNCVTLSLDVGASSTLLGTTTKCAENGIAEFTDISYNVAEPITIVLTSGSLQEPMPRFGLTVDPLVPFNLAFTHGPPSVISEYQTIPAIVVEVQTASGTRIGSDNGTIVTLSGPAELQGTLMRTVVGGVAVFDDLVYVPSAKLTVGTSFMVTVDDPAPDIMPPDLNADTATINVEPTVYSGIEVALASVDSAEALANNASNGDVSLSVDGRFVAFTSRAGNLVAGDTNGAIDVFVRDRFNGTTERVSLPPAGGQFSNLGTDPGAEISGNGRYVVFRDITTGQIYRRDRLMAVTEAVSLNVGGNNVAGVSKADVSFDGRYIAFAGDTVGNVYVRDMLLGETQEMSITNAGDPGACGCGSSDAHVRITPDGRQVVFSNSDTNLVAGATGGVFVHDRDVSNDGVFDELGDISTTLVVGDQSDEFSISDDGRHIVYLDSGSVYILNRDIGDTGLFDQPGNIARIDISALIGTTDMSDFVLSGGGRFLAFVTNTNLDPVDPINSQDIYVLDRDVSEDGVFDDASDFDVALASVTRTGARPATTTQGNLAPAISSDGRYIGFETEVATLVSGDTNGVSDIAVVPNPLLPAKLAFGVRPPTTVPEGVNWPPFTVAVQNPFGAVLTDEVADVRVSLQTGTGNLREGGVNCPGVDCAKTTVDGVATFGDISYDTFESIEINVDSGLLFPILPPRLGTQVSVTECNAAAQMNAAQLQFRAGDAPDPMQQAGQVWQSVSAGNIVVEMLNCAGNPVYDMDRPVTFQLTSASGTLLGTVTQTAIDNAGTGEATFDDLLYNVAEDVYFNVTSPGLTPIFGQMVTVDVGPPAQIVFGTPPSANGLVGTTLDTFTVEVQDSVGNIIESAADQIDIVQTSPASPNGTFTGSTSVVTNMGVATFDDISYTYGEVVGFSVTHPSLPDITGVSISFVGPPVKLVFRDAPRAQEIVGISWRAFTVEVQDFFGNLILDAQNQVSLQLDSGTGQFDSQSSTVPQVGIANFTSVRYTATEPIEFSVTAPGLIPITGVMVNVVGPPVRYRITPSNPFPLTETAGEDWTSLTIQLEDASGQTVDVIESPDFLRVELFDNTGDLFLDNNTNVANSFETDFVGGSVVLDNLSYRVAERIFMRLTSVVGSSSGQLILDNLPVDVRNAPAQVMTIVQQPPAETARGSTIGAIGLELRDQFNNIAIDDNSTVVEAQLGLGSGSLMGSLLRTAQNGYVVFNDLSYDAGDVFDISLTADNPSVGAVVTRSSRSTTLVDPGLQTFVSSFTAVQPQRDLDNDGNLDYETGDGLSTAPALSADGRFVAFESVAQNILLTTSGFRTTMLHDYAVDPFGAQFLGSQFGVVSAQTGFNVRGSGANVDLSEDGGYMAFETEAQLTFLNFFGTSSLVDTNGVKDIYVYDIFAPVSPTDVAGQSVLASRRTDDALADDESTNPALSPDGSWVVFESKATNLMEPVETVIGVGDGVQTDFSGAVVGVSPVDSRASGNVYLRYFTASGEYSCTNPASLSSLLECTDGGTGVFDFNTGTFTSLNLGVPPLAGADLEARVQPLDANGFADLYAHDMVNERTFRLTQAMGGGDADGRSLNPHVSLRGRYVVFESDATNLVPNDDEGNRDVFLLDRDPDGNAVLDEGNSTVTRLSAEPAMTANGGDGDSFNAKISNDGMTVVFDSTAENLVAGDAGDGFAQRDVFMVDLSGLPAFTITRVSVSTMGAVGDADSLKPDISANGRYVAFESTATTLLDAGADTNGVSDIFVRDLASGITAIASLDRSMALSNAASTDAAISPNGRRVAYASAATNISYDQIVVSNNLTSIFDINGIKDVFSSPNPLGGPYELAFVDAPEASYTAGETWTSGGGPITVQLLDTLGAPATDTGVPVTIAITSAPMGAGPLLGTVTRTTVNGVATFDDLSFETAGAITAQASSNLLLPVSAPITINHDAAVALRMADIPEPTATAGVNWIGDDLGGNVLIEVIDQFGNRATSDNATMVQLSVASGTDSSLMGTRTRTVVAGLASFDDINHERAETITVAFDDVGATLDTSLTQNVSVVVAPAAPVRVGFSVGAMITLQKAGVQWDAFSVEIQDAFGNLVVGQPDTLVSVTLDSGMCTTGGIILGTSQRIAVNGIATFNNIECRIAETLVLSANDISGGGLASSLSPNIVVAPNSAAGVVYITPPASPQVVGVPIAPAIQVQAVDVYGNIVPDANNLVATGIVTGTSTLTGTLIRSTVDGTLVPDGTAEFDDLVYDIAETVVIGTEFGGGLPASPSLQTTVTFLPAAADRLSISANLLDDDGPASLQTAGVAWDDLDDDMHSFGQTATKIGNPIRIRVVDAFGNVTDPGPANVTASIDTGAGDTCPGGLQGTLTQPVVNGVATFDDLRCDTVGTYAIDFVGDVAPIDTNTLQDIMVSVQPNQGAQVAFVPNEGLRVSEVAGQPWSRDGTPGNGVRVRILDAYGNQTTANSSFIVTASVVGGAGVLFGTLTADPVNGFAEFDDLRYNVAEDILVNFAITTGTPASATLTILPAGPDHLAFAKSPPSVTQQNTVMSYFTVQLIDEFDNLITTDSASMIELTLGTGTGNISGTTTRQLEEGVATFNDIVHDTVEQIDLQFRETTDSIPPLNSGNINVRVGPGLQEAIVNATFGGDSGSELPSISYDGRFTAFSSLAGNLAGGSTFRDIFVRDRIAGATERINIPEFFVADGSSTTPDISADGRYVVYESDATTLIAANTDTNARRDVFIRDRVLATTTRVSRSTNGLQGNGASQAASVSGDGRYIAFESSSTNFLDPIEGVLAVGDGTTTDFGGSASGVFPVIVKNGNVQLRYETAEGVKTCTNSDAVVLTNIICDDGGTGTFDFNTGIFTTLDLGVAPSAAADIEFALKRLDTNNAWDVFVHDQVTGVTRRMSVVTLTGAESALNQSSYDPDLSATGRYVAFESDADLLGGADPTGRDIYVADRDIDGNGVFDETPPTLTLVSYQTGGVAVVGNGESINASINSDGTLVAFESLATNLLGAGVDTSNARDVFVRDIGGMTTTRVSVAEDGVTELAGAASRWPQISWDGRYVVFESDSTAIPFSPPLDTNVARDVFVHDRMAMGATRHTTLISQSADGVLGSNNSDQPSLSGDGRYVAFRSTATQLVAGDVNGAADIFIAPNDVVGPYELVVTNQPGAVETGEAFSNVQSITVEIRDIDGNLVTNATNTVTITKVGGTAPGAILGTLSRAAVGGIATFDDLHVDTIGDLGPRTIDLEASATRLITDAVPAITVNPAPAAALVYLEAPDAAQIAGDPWVGDMGGDVVLELEDAFGNRATLTNLDIKIAPLAGATDNFQMVGGSVDTVTSVAGLATFSMTNPGDISYDTAETFTIVFDDTGSTLDNSAVSGLSVTVGHAAPDRVVFGTNPNGNIETAGASWSAFTARIEDQYGNLINDDNATVIDILNVNGSVTGAITVG